MLDNLLIIARCDIWCVGLGQACGGEMEGGEGERRREQGAMGMRWQSQLINTCVWLLEVRGVTVTFVTSLRREGIRAATKTLL